MKIAHISTFYLPTIGGVEQVIYELATRQVQQGHEVHVFCCDSDKNKRLNKKEEILDGVHVHRLPYIARLSLYTFIWPSLLWRFSDYNKEKFDTEKILPVRSNFRGVQKPEKSKRVFDIIHTHVSGHDYVLFAGILSRLNKIKHIHTTHCPWTDASFRPFYLRPFLFFNHLFFNKLAYSLIDKIIAITPWELDTIEQYADKKKISVIPNGMDRILYEKIKNNNFRKKYNIKEKYLVLYFGRLNPTKGPEKLAQAAIEISKKRKDIFFLWVGPDEGKAKEVQAMIKPYKNMKYIGALRGKKKISEMYQASDVYVLPSYREGLPLTLFEAMASGLPIVASPVNGVPYEMSEKNGFFSNYGDIESLKKNILKLIDNPKLRKTISENNKKKAKNYIWENIFDKYMSEYHKLIN